LHDMIIHSMTENIKECRWIFWKRLPGRFTRTLGWCRYTHVPADLRSILTLEVPLIVVIASRDLPVKEVMNLVPGAIIELPKLADEELEILVNNKPIGLGNAVKVGENFGIRVTYVGNLKDRIKALADPEAVKPDAMSVPDDHAAAALAEELLAGQAN